MRMGVSVGTKEFKDGHWCYLMDPDDGYYLDDEEFQRQKLQKPDEYTPVYICSDYFNGGRTSTMYDREELWWACDRDSELTEYIFDCLMGESPEDLLEEYLNTGRVVKCPHCNKYIFREDVEYNS